MSLVVYISFACLGLYAALLGWLALGFARTRRFSVPAGGHDVPVTIIICARNEERNIAACLGSLLKQSYDRSLVQVLLVNDAGTDTTVQQAEAILASSGFEYTIVSNPVHKGKKQSIAYAMQLAHHELIVTRDADTYTKSDKWLKSISAFYQAENPHMIIGPIALSDNFGILWALQAIENNILALMAGGSAFYKLPFLNSGANLAFTKTAFLQTGAYASHMHIASGDDVLFLEALKKMPGAKIAYLKSGDAIVHTYPCRSLGSLIRQKVRWASKFRVNSNPLNFLLAALSFAVNLGWLFCLVYGYAKPHDNSASLLFVLCKLVIDFLLLFLASGFIRNRLLYWFSLPVGCVYPVYACIVALASLLIKPRWKN